jgi:outer membrane receptor protein involved in Fe transport
MLRGTITNLDSTSPLDGAAVRIAAAGLETFSASDGTYKLDSVPAGTHTVEVTNDGFVPATFSAQVEDGGELIVDIALSTIGERTVDVVGRIREATRVRETLKRKAGTAVSESISKEEMKQVTGSDVAQVSKSLTGVSVSEGKFVFVRGLGDRYSQTLVNGAVLPSPEPDRRVIPLDLFPANLVESISIAKTYSPDTPGEFAGGSVRITTVEVPQDPFFSLSLGLKYLDGTTLRDFQSYHGGNLDLFGYDDGTRTLPKEVPRDQVRVGSEGRGLTEEDVQRIGRAFPNIWDASTTSAPPEHKVGASFGYRFGMPGDTSLGIIGALNWGNSYQTVRNETFRVLLNQGTVEDPDPFVFNDFKLNTFSYETEVSALLNIAFELNPAQKFGIRNLYTHASEDEVRLQSGFGGQQGRELRVTRLEYVERGLFSTQAYGEHLLIGDAFLEWRAGYALSQRDEPDNRQVRYDLDDFLGEFRYQDVSGSGSRDFYLLDENIYDAGIDFSIPFAPIVGDVNPDVDRIAPDQKIKLGGAVLVRDRDFDTRRFRFVPDTGRPLDAGGNPIDLTTTSLEDLFQSGHINPDGFGLDETTRPTDNYNARQEIFAGYGLVDFRTGSINLGWLFGWASFAPALQTYAIHDIRLQGGARVENSTQEVITFELFGEDPELVTADLQTTDVLPAFNVTVELVKDLQLRLGFSQTVSRPEFRELAEFEFTDVAGGFAARGNPDLERATIDNFDLRLEYYPEPGDVLSASVFFKQFDQPIEQVILPTSSSLLTTWQNADSADLIGFEVEGRKNLGFIAEALRGFTLVGNLAILETEVTLADDQISVQTNDQRPLQGQPEYILNLGLFYEIKEAGLSVAALANTFGERISAVGAFGVPDEEEQSRWTVDLSISKRVGKGSLKLSVENLLDEKFEFKQGDITTREFKKGFSVGLSYSISF